MERAFGSTRRPSLSASILTGVLLVAGAACHNDTVNTLHPQLAYDCPVDLTNAGMSLPASNGTCAGLDFGTVKVGSTKTLTLRLANIGRSTLKVMDGDLDGTANGTLVASSVPASLAPQTSTLVQVTFAPTYALTVDQKYIFDTDDANSPHVQIPVHGVGDGHPQPTTDVRQLDFGNVHTGTTKYLSVRVTNQGNVPMVITQTEVVDDPAEFAAPAVSTLILPSQSVNQPVSFTPKGAGDDSATLHITVDSTRPDGTPTGADVSVLDVALTGQSIPKLVVDPTSLDLGMLTWHGTVTKGVAFGNEGLAPVKVKKAYFEPGASPFLTLTQAVTFPTSVPPGAMVMDALTVTYTPPERMDPTPISDSATLVVESDDPANSVVRISISGSCSCAYPGPLINVTPTSIDFSSISPGYGTRTATVTIQSLGSQPVTILAIKPSAGSPIDFVAGNEIPPNTAIPPATSKTFTITYKQRPREDTYALVNGGVDVVSDDTTNPLITVSLSGVCRAGPGAPDGDGDGIPDACDACLFDGKNAPTYQNAVYGDGMTFSNGTFTGQTGSRPNIMTSASPGQTLQVEYDYQLTGLGPQCGLDPTNETQYYVGVVDGASNGTDCVFDGVACQMMPAGASQLSGHRQTSITAPDEPGTYYVQYDWSWAPMCAPETFQARGASNGFAAFCVKK